MKNLSFKSIVLMTFLSLCTTNSTADSVNKINNCVQRADEIEKVFDEIQIEAYQSEIYKSYSYIDATKLDYVTEALRINKIGIDGLEDIVSRYEINNKELQKLKVIFMVLLTYKSLLQSPLVIITFQTF